ncbi:5131_t:CDS:1, partial [Racocetra persica]
ACARYYANETVEETEQHRSTQREVYAYRISNQTIKEAKHC